MLVAALAAATFVLSYAGMHSFALEAGIEGRFARGYPLLVDAMIVIAGASVLALRGAGLPSKFLAWLILLIMLGAAAAADAIHASGHKLPGKYGSIIAAVVPWVLAFIAFVLLLVIFRYVHLRMLAAARDRIEAHDLVADGQLTVRRPGLSGHAPLRPGQSGSFGQGPFAQDPFPQDPSTLTPPRQGQLDQGTGAAASIVPGLDRNAASQAGFAHQVLSVPRQPGPASAADAGDSDRSAVNKQSAAGAASDDAQPTTPDAARATTPADARASAPADARATTADDGLATTPEDARGTGLPDEADAVASAVTQDADLADDDQVDMRFHQIRKPSASEAWTITSDTEPTAEASAASDDQPGGGGQDAAEGKAEPGRPADLDDKTKPDRQSRHKAESKGRTNPKGKAEPRRDADDADG
jgi:hypothetical protein